MKHAHATLAVAVAVALAALLVALAVPPASAQILFRDATADSGIAFVNHGGPVWGDRPPSHVGSGATAGDYDNDGDLDLYLCDALNWPNQLWRNEGDGTFVEVGAAAGVADTGYSQMALFLDLDNDGRLDLVVVNNDQKNPNLPSPPSRVYRNLGDGTFADVTAGSGFVPSERIVGGFGAGDYDGDGDLDLSVVGWNDASTFLFRNEGDFTFTDVTQSAGAFPVRAHNNPAYQLGVVHVDLDGDGMQDIFSSVDFSANYLLHNDGDGTFTEVSAATGMDSTSNDMGIAVADVDDDGDLDVYVTDITGTGSDECFFPIVQGGCNTLHINDGNGNFTDVAGDLGIDNTDWGWGTWFLDADLDGDRDLMAVNGFDTVTTPNQRARLFRNEGGAAAWTNVAQAAQIAHDGDSRTLLPWDYDNDGDVDVLILDAEDAAFLYENVTPRNGNGWLTVKASDPLGSRDGVGARVHVTTGAQTQMWEVFVGGSFYAGPPLEAHFGLGAAAIVDEVRVEFPSGHVVRRFDVAPDRRLELGPLDTVTGLAVGRVPGAPAEARVVWDPVLDAEGYDVLRGTFGPPWPPGGGAFYLARATTTLGVRGPLGAGAAGVARVNANPGDCP